MYDENDLINSPLEREFTSNGKTVQVCIYRMPDSGWTLEVVDEYNNSTVWDEQFKTDQEAIDVFLEELSRDGIEAFIGFSPEKRLH